MNTSDPWLLIGQIRHREFLEIAERERLIQAARKNQSNNRSSRLMIFNRIRGRLLENRSSKRTPYEQNCKSISSVP